MTPEGIQLIKMETHDTLDLEDGTTVRRVIGGWVYTTTHNNGQTIAVTSCFVPNQRENVVT